MKTVHSSSSRASVPGAVQTRRMRAAALLAAMALLAGCAANVTQEAAPAAGTAATATAPSTSPVAGAEADRRATAARQVRIVVRAAPAVQQDGNWPTVRDLWQQALADAAQARGLRVATGGAAGGPTVQIDVQVNGFRYVATAARWTLGVFTGNAAMDVTASLSELPARRSLGSERYQTSSRAMEGIFSAASPKQIEALAARIVESIR